MSTISGQLLWRRIRFGTGGSFVALVPGDTDIDTGVTQVSGAFQDPPIGIPGPSAPADGALPASRIQIVPEAPLDAWAFITHGEPYYNTVTRTCHVVFHNSDCSSHSFNVLVWDPHTLVGPGQADIYNKAN